jgi:hypothetical protein
LQAELSDDGRNKGKTVLRLTSGNLKAGEGRRRTKRDKKKKTNEKDKRKGLGLKDRYYD